MIEYRISAGALLLRDNRALLRHLSQRYDLWAPLGGSVESNETMEAAAERETIEKTGLPVRAGLLAYIDELWSPISRTIKLWFVVDLLTGEIDLDNNPVLGESIVAALWIGPHDRLCRA
ncbi:MAG: NUDIX hydrolase [Candidatus Devosia symbiotica]|nr:NUDIX hydrolase [Candidatus Devosia symbiotica]